jgi:hypothetical protein
MKASIHSGKDIILGYMDTSYVHTAHSVRCPYVEKGDSSINKSASKGQRLIILHTISDKGLSVKELEASLLMNLTRKETHHIQESNWMESSPPRCFFGW